MMLDQDLLAEDGAAQRHDPDKLETLMGLAVDLLKAREVEDEAATALATATEARRQLEEHDVPELMASLGLQQLKTADGSVISLYQDVVASIPVEQRDAAHRWLREHGFGDLIKNNVTTSFGAGEDEFASQLIELIEKSGLRYGSIEHKEAVHVQTLRKFCRDRLAAAEELPVDLLGVRMLSRAKVTKK